MGILHPNAYISLWSFEDSANGNFASKRCGLPPSAILCFEIMRRFFVAVMLIRSCVRGIRIKNKIASTDSANGDVTSKCLAIPLWI